MLVSSLAQGGVLLYETFARGNERYGRPSNPEFLLEPGELLQGPARALRIVAYEDVRVDAAARAGAEDLRDQCASGAWLVASSSRAASVKLVGLRRPWQARHAGRTTCSKVAW